MALVIHHVYDMIWKKKQHSNYTLLCHNRARIWLMLTAPAQLWLSYGNYIGMLCDVDAGCYGHCLDVALPSLIPGDWVTNTVLLC